MSNPFEDATASYLVLATDAPSFSLWPAALDVPAGWTVCWGPGPRAEALAEVEQRWDGARNWFSAISASS
jgi:MbtH protein